MKNKLFMALGLGISFFAVTVSAISTLAWFQIDNQEHSFSYANGANDNDLIEIDNDNINGFKYNYDEETSSSVSTTNGTVIGLGKENIDEDVITTIDNATQGVGYYYIPYITDIGYNYSNTGAAKMSDRYDGNYAYIDVELSVGDKFIVRQHNYESVNNNTHTIDTEIKSFSNFTIKIDEVNTEECLRGNGTTGEITTLVAGWYRLYVNASKQVAIGERKDTEGALSPMSMANIDTRSNSQQERKSRRNAKSSTLSQSGFSDFTVEIKNSGGLNTSDKAKWVAEFKLNKDSESVKKEITNWGYEATKTWTTSDDANLFNYDYLKILRQSGEGTTWNSWEIQSGLKSYNYIKVSRWDTNGDDFKQTKSVLSIKCVDGSGTEIQSSSVICWNHNSISSASGWNSTPSITGYTRTNSPTWYNAATGGSSVLLSDWIEANATIYARFSANTNTITFDQIGGTGGSASVTATYASSMPSATMPTRAGFTFQGYFTAKNGGGTKYYNADGSSAKNWDIDEATTLYAHWLPSSTSYYYLIGYNVKYDGTNFSDWNPGELVYGASGDGYLAKWDDVYLGANAKFKIVTWDSGIKWIANDEIAYSTNTNATKIGFGRETSVNYNFTCTSAGTYDIYLVNESGYKIKASKTVGIDIYEKHEGATSSKIRTDNQDTDTAYSPTVPPVDGYHITNWEYNETSINWTSGSKPFSGDTLITKLTANLDADTFTVSFDANGGSGDMSEDSFTATYNENSNTHTIPTNTFTRDGYLFRGWSKTSGDENTKHYNPDQQLSSTNIHDLWPGSNGGTRTLYAVWEEVTLVTVTIVSNNDDYGSVNVTSIEVAVGTVFDDSTSTISFTYNGDPIGSSVATFTPQDNGYTYAFDSWEVTSGSVTNKTISEDITITANFTATPRPYGVTLNKNGGTVNAGNITQYTYNVATTLPTNVTKTGYTFAGWYFESNFSGTRQYTISAGTYGSQVYYAKWTANQTAITFDRESGTGGSSSATATYDASMPSASMPTRDGYTFGGYYDGDDGTGTQYYNASGSSVREWDKDVASYTLHAKWTINTYTLAYSGTNYSSVVFYKSSSKTEVNKITSATYGQTNVYYTATGARGYQTAEGGPITITNSSPVALSTLTADGTATITINPSSATPKVYTISLDVNSSATITAEVTVAGTTEIYLKYNDGYYLTNTAGVVSDKMATSAPKNPVPTLPANTDYDFDGYYTAASGGTKYINADGTITSDGADAGKTFFYDGQTLKLYAHWTRRSRTVYYNYSLFTKDKNSDDSPSSYTSQSISRDSSRSVSSGDNYNLTDPETTSYAVFDRTEFGLYKFEWDGVFYTASDYSSSATSLSTVQADTDIYIKLIATYQTIYVSIKRSDENWQSRASESTIYLHTTDNANNTFNIRDNNNDMELTKQSDSEGIRYFKVSKGFEIQIYNGDSGTANGRYTTVISFSNDTNITCNDCSGKAQDRCDMIEIVNGVGDNQWHAKWIWSTYFTNKTAYIYLYDSSAGTTTPLTMYRGDGSLNMFVYDLGYDIPSGQVFAIKANNKWYGYDDLDTTSKTYVGDNGVNAMIGSQSTDGVVHGMLTTIRGYYSFYITTDDILSIASVPKEKGDGYYIMPYSSTPVTGKNNNTLTYENGIKMRTTTISGNGNVAYYKNFYVDADNSKYYVRSFIHGVANSEVKNIDTKSVVCTEGVNSLASIDSLGILTINTAGYYDIYVVYEDGVYRLDIRKSATNKNFFLLNGFSGSAVVGNNTTMILEIPFRSNSDKEVTVGADFVRTTISGGISRYLKYNVYCSTSRLSITKNGKEYQFGREAYNYLRTNCYSSAVTFSSTSAPLLNKMDTTNTINAGDTDWHYLYILMDYNTAASTVSGETHTNDFYINIKATN